MVLALKPLHDEYKINRVVVSTYQAVSGAGKAPMDELFEQTKDYLENKEKLYFLFFIYQKIVLVNEKLYLIFRLSFYCLRYMSKTINLAMWVF